VNALLRKLISKIDAADARGVALSSHLMTLYALALHSTGAVVECGVGAGFSTLALLAGASEAGLSLTSYDWNPGALTSALENWKLDRKDPLLAHWCFVHKDSVEAAADWTNGEVGLLFVDTNHYYRETLQELRTWAPKIRPDGIICGHDYLLHLDPEWKSTGVQRAVDRFVSYDDRFELEVLKRDYGLFILWPRTRA
jgi:predicted O-methyltransferase YrrM